ncbi:hypothetical protein [Leuconostoc suionicum]|uniref:hypothetical protein n=1 Tax=Leuconostoc suionicum TaxID=1511761 RepID=UPI0032DEC796
MTHFLKIYYSPSSDDPETRNKQLTQSIFWQAQTQTIRLYLKQQASTYFVIRFIQA